MSMKVGKILQSGKINQFDLVLWQTPIDHSKLWSESPPQRRPPCVLALWEDEPVLFRSFRVRPCSLQGHVLCDSQEAMGRKEGIPFRKGIPEGLET